MKTICPYCRQQFPDTPDEYLGTTLECPMCKKNFVCARTKFCSACGAANPAEAAKCAECGAPFPAPPQHSAPPTLRAPGFRAAAVEEEDIPDEPDEETPGRRRRIAIGAAAAAIVAVLLSLPAAYNYFVYRRDCRELKRFQDEKARRYAEAREKMRAFLKDARLHRLGSNANKHHRMEDLERFAAAYNRASPEALGLPELDSQTVSDLKVMIYFSDKDAYSCLVLDLWRKQLEEIFGPIDELK